ncbi:MAG: AzlC family ABC transporter permease [Synechococcales cyanobacterium]
MTGLLTSDPAQAFWQGVRDTMPLIVGAIPFGLIFGTLAASSGLSAGAAVAMSALVFAGSSQFIALGLWASQTPILLIMATTLIVNLRHLLYAAGLVPYIPNLPPLWRLALGFWLTDETFMVVIRRYQRRDPDPHVRWYHLGSALSMYINWQACTILGVTLGGYLPNAAAWGLDFAMVATFIGLVIPYVVHQGVNRPMLATVVVSGAVAVLARGLPHQLGLMVAALAGITVGFGLDLAQSPQQQLPSP